MMPFISLELRWFFSGDLLPGLETWFSEGVPSSETKSDAREDVYLYQPGVLDFGIKIRKKKPDSPYSLEVKWRQAATSYRGPRGVTGNAERWLKWGWDDDAGPDSAQLDAWTIPSGPWISVGKVRRQTKYRWDESAKGFVAESPDNFPAYGAAIEVTQLELAGRMHSTVLVETFAPEPAMQAQILDAAVETFWQHFPKPFPGPDLSFGYPDWLSKNALSASYPSLAVSR